MVCSFQVFFNFILTTLKNKSLCSKSPDFPSSLVLLNKHPCVSADWCFFGTDKPGHTGSSRLSGLQRTQLLYASNMHLHKCFFFYFFLINLCGRHFKHVLSKFKGWYFECSVDKIRRLRWEITEHAVIQLCLMA